MRPEGNARGKSNMRIHDISVVISTDMPVYPGDPPVSISPFLSISKGDKVNVSALALGSHTGTHLDAPRHFFENGRGMSELELELLAGRATVLQLDVAQEIRREHLEGADLRGTERLLLGTANSALWREAGFQEDYIYLTEDTARHLVELGVKLVGLDYLSVEKFGSSEAPVHRALLQNDVVILEGLNLTGIEPGEYELICLPLRLNCEDGAPARAILREVK